MANKTGLIAGPRWYLIAIKIEEIYKYGRWKALTRVIKFIGTSHHKSFSGTDYLEFSVLWNRDYVCVYIYVWKLHSLKY